MFNNFVQKYITVKNIIFFIVAILFLKFLGYIQDVAIMLFASFVISSSLEPAVSKLSKKFKRSTATAIVLGGTILGFLLFIVPIFVLSAQEIKKFAILFPQHIETMKEYISSLPFATHSILANINIGGMLSSATGFTGQVIGETIHIGKGLGSALVYLIASVIIIYYFIADKDKIHATFLKLFPKQIRTKADDIVNTIVKKIGGYVIAQLVTIASVGIIMTIGLLLLRVEYAVLLGLITAVLDIIPIIGPTIALIICLAVSYKSGIGVLALITLVFAITQLTENNVVRPYIFSKFFDLHPIIIYISLFITAKYLGIIGLVFAPAIAATAVVLIEELYMKNLE